LNASIIRRLSSTAIAAIVVAAVAASAGATTSPTNYKIFDVRLTDSGVSFKPKAQLEAGEVGLFRVRNVSKSKRVFAVSVRATHVLSPKAKESFYELFVSTGKVKWSSHTSKGRSYTGFVTVVPCVDSSGTSLCNGTGG
jgi:arginine/ornithine N-succinyltransferase beta subunit